MSGLPWAWLWLSGAGIRLAELAGPQRLWARLTAATGRLWGGQCLSDPRVWVGEPTRVCVWTWAALSPASMLIRNSKGMGWTRSFTLPIHPGDIFVPGLDIYPKPTEDPGRYLSGCSKIDWPGGREVSDL